LTESLIFAKMEDSNHGITTSTPYLDYEPGTGYIVLTDGKLRQVVCAACDDFSLELQWKWTKEKIIVKLEELIALLRRATVRAIEPDS